MRINQITEATNVNMNIIQQLTNMVLDKLPDKIGESTHERGLTIRINTDELKEKYPKFKDFFEYIDQTRFLFLNSIKYESSKVKGFYSPTSNVIGVNVSGIKGMYYQYSKEHLLKKDENIFGIYGVLYHELRHVMQHKDYPDYFKKDVETDDYRKKDTEIDAMWYNIIGSYNIKRFKPKAFANRVMDDLERNRDLTPKQFDHYYKKTLKYYTDPESVIGTKKKSKEDIIKNVIPSKIIGIIHKIDNEYDLRKIQNYDYSNFLFPVNNVKASTIKSLRNGQTDSNFIKNMMYLVPSLGSITPNIAKMHRIYMNKVHKYDVTDAIENIQVGMPENHFDFDALKKHLNKTYGGGITNTSTNEGKISNMAKAGGNWRSVTSIII